MGETRLRCCQMKKMLFKFGLTVIIFVAVYIYFAKEHVNDRSNTKEGDKSQQDVKEAQTPAASMGQDRETDELKTHEFSTRSPHIHLSVVACGDRLEETLIMLKSSVLFTQSHLVFHIFAEDSLHNSFKEQLDFWPPLYRQQIEYHIYNISFPDTQSAKAADWKKLFKPCACQRLFMPSLLHDVDAVLYVDTDILFMSPIDELWTMFAHFNSSQLAAVAPEQEDRATGWYNRFARHPYYGELGINSGVMLMNLTRLRASSWLKNILEYHLEYKFKITFGDQDLINIYFHFHPEELYIFSCEWNYRPDHCMYMSVCPPAEGTGVKLLHGSRRTWHEDKQPAMRAVYMAFKEHRLGASLEFELLEALEAQLNKAPTSNCGQLHQKSQLFTKTIQTFVKQKKATTS